MNKIQKSISLEEFLCIDGCFKMKSIAVRDGEDVILKMHKEDVGSVLEELLENGETVEVIGIEENVEVCGHDVDEIFTDTLDKAIVLRVKWVGLED